MSNLPDIPVPFPEYADAAERRRRTHPVAVGPLLELLQRRPELAGRGVSYVAEAVTA